MIDVRGLTKTYTVHEKAPGLVGSIKSLFVRKRIEKHAVKGVTLQVSEGEILGLVGPNGAGKTTLVKMLAGIIHPSAGSASVLGHTPWERDNAFRLCGLSVRFLFAAASFEFFALVVVPWHPLLKQTPEAFWLLEN